MASLLIVGASDTGRAPVAAALLRRLLQDQGVAVDISSAGVLGHDDEGLQDEARLALEHFIGEAPEHQARSVSDELVAGAELLLAIDHGTGRVLSLHYPQHAQRLVVLPELAQGRSIPDPTQMSLDAWIIYGRELLDQLRAALPLLQERLIAGALPAGSAQPTSAAVKAPAAPAPADAAAVASASSTRQEPLADLQRLLQALDLAPEIVDWTRARELLGRALAALASAAEPGDLTTAVVAMLQGLLAQQPGVLSSGQTRWLLKRVALLEQPVGTTELAAIAADAAHWQTM